MVRKQRKPPYILPKYLLVVTYCDDEKNEWHMLMPTELRESLAPSLPFFLDCAMKGVKAPSPKSSDSCPPYSTLWVMSNAVRIVHSCIV